MKRPLFIFLAALLFAVIVVPASAQTAPPPQIQAALNLFSGFIGRPIGLVDLDRWGYTQDFYTDSSLGCSLIATPTSFADPVSAATVELYYQSIRYEFRVRDDLLDAFPCDATLMGLVTPGAVISQTTTPGALATNCPVGFPGYLTPRLIVGGQGRIGTSGTANRIRSRPARDAEQIGLIDPGTTVDILDGPSCEDATKIIWWRVNSNGTIGWTAEGIGGDYFLAPVAGGPLDLPEERSLLTTTSFSGLTSLATLSFLGASSVSFSDTDLVVIGGQEGLLIYDLATLQQLDLPLDIQPQVQHVAFSPDGRYLAYNDFTGKVFITDTDTGVTITPSDLPVMSINALEFSTTNLLAIGAGSTGTVATGSAWYIYDIPNQRQLAVQATTSYVSDVGFNPDGSLFAWLDTALNIINVADGSAVLTQPISQAGRGGLEWRPGIAPGSPNQIAYTDGNRMILYTLGGSVQLFGDAPEFFPGIVHFLPDGSLLAGMSLRTISNPEDTVINAFDTATGLILYGTGFDLGMDFAFSPDGTLMVVVTEDQVQFFGTDTELLAVG